MNRTFLWCWSTGTTARVVPVHGRHWLVKHFATYVPKTHPNAITPDAPCVFVMPSVPLCRHAFKALSDLGVDVGFYKDFSGLQWYGQHAVLVCCFKSFLHKVDATKRHAMILISEIAAVLETANTRSVSKSHVLVMCRATSCLDDRFVCTTVPGTETVVPGADAFAKGKHLLDVLRMAHVVVLESADATCDVLCLAKQAKGDLNKVYLRQNNGKPRTKKVFDLHPTPETWFNLVFKCVKEHPDKKTVIMCDSKAACEKLERIFDAFLFDCLGRHPHDARFARIQVRVP